uniref:Quinol oxidase subunit 4 n=1 Tax=Chryseobacterium endophyticum TaxID=1854762 RepID=A0AAU6WP05_9FLAO
MPLLLALIATASFCEAQRSKRYSGKQEKAPKKTTRKPEVALRAK